MNEALTSLLDDLNHYATYDADQRVACARRTEWIDGATDGDVESMLDALIQCEHEILTEHAGPLIEVVFARLVQRFHDLMSRSPLQLNDHTRKRIALLYSHLGRGSKCRHHLLGVLVAVAGPEDIASFVELIVEDPPVDVTAIAQVFTPLFRHQKIDPSLLFPRLLDGLTHVSIAAPILDLANFLTREDFVEQHPASERVGQLASLLGELARRLDHLAENPDGGGETTDSIEEKVSEGVSLAVSLCDALALIGDKSVVGKLYTALELGHRRVRTEAAAALAKLGEKTGEQELVKMAAEPVARLRTLAYADELGLLGHVEEQFQTPIARAEAELALHLAQPSQLGLPPTKCELIDERTQFWPGFDDEIECYLFRFTYEFGDRKYSNIGIVGPLTHALAADLADLSPGDIYAIFAGWQAEHADIYEIDADKLNDTQESQARRLRSHLHDEGYASVEPVMLGFFFGDQVLIASATRDSTKGLAITDMDDVFWYPSRNLPRPLGPAEVYCIYKGRKLLQTFNA